VRLTAGDLKVLGTFLFGPRWQCALARAIGRSDRQLRRWVAGELLVSIQASRLIEELVRSKHGEQMRRLRAGYLNMIAGLTDSGIRGRAYWRWIWPSCASTIRSVGLAFLSS
jgi:hypothetical protein